MIHTWRFHRSAFFEQMVYVHTQDKPIEVFSGWKFSLDIPTPFTIDLLKLADEVKAAMSNINQTEGNKFQVAPLSRRSFGNYGQSRPTQAWNGTFHYELEAEASNNASGFWNRLSHHRPRRASIINSPSLTTRVVSSWRCHPQMCPGKVGVCGVQALDNKEILNSLVNNIEKFNKQSSQNHEYKRPAKTS